MIDASTWTGRYHWWERRGTVFIQRHAGDEEGFRLPCYGINTGPLFDLAVEGVRLLWGYREFWIGRSWQGKKWCWGHR